MAWIEFHSSKIKRLKKFRDFRIAMGWSDNEALGLLGNLWGEVIEVQEDGDLSGWTPEYVAELTSVKSDLAGKLWKALVDNHWIETGNGSVMVHDWLDYAKTYLRSKYKTRKKERLVEIWIKHGRVYGEKDESEDREVQGKAQGRPREVLPYLTLPNLTQPNHFTSLNTKSEKKVGGSGKADNDKDALIERRMPFGDYEDMKIVDMPIDRVRWLLTEFEGRAGIVGWLREALEYRLKLKADEGIPERR